MKFRRIFEDAERYYCVGVDEETGAGIIEVLVTGVAWRSYFFRLTLDEFAEFQQNPRALEDLAERLARDKGSAAYQGRLIQTE